MAKTGFKKGDIVRRNRQPAEIDKVSQTSVHLSILTDFTFRVYTSEIVPLEKASVLLRLRPKKFYTWTLVKKPDRLEAMCGEDLAGVMALILQEWKTPFGKREFKQILLQDDQVVTEDRWNSFWTRAYKAMREDPRFAVDDHSRYSLVEDSAP
jgi:transcription elongation factor GreA-like protein